MRPLHIRSLAESDYQPIIRVLDDWWGGRPMASLLPRLFFQHFQTTSFAAEEEGRVVAFLVGFVSQTDPHDAYIHFVGVEPSQRGRGLGRMLYETFFEIVRQYGCTRVHCVTSPVNGGSIAFHQRIGFRCEPGDGERDGIPVHRDYDAGGEERVVFCKTLQTVPKRRD